MRKKLICIDFDGVLHSYKSGWQGPRNIPNPPVKGAINWLSRLLNHGDIIEVCIYSSRNKYFRGKAAMRAWLLRYGLPKDKIGKIKFPTKKPAAWVTIDDRAIVFTGKFPGLKKITDFKPWYLRKP